MKYYLCLDTICLIRYQYNTMNPDVIRNQEKNHEIRFFSGALLLTRHNHINNTLPSCHDETLRKNHKIRFILWITHIQQIIIPTEYPYTQQNHTNSIVILLQREVKKKSQDPFYFLKHPHIGFNPITLLSWPGNESRKNHKICFIF